MSSASGEDVPGGRCGFTLSPADLGEDRAEWYEDGTDEWYAAGPGMVTCIREPWTDTGRCIWHAETEGKIVEELQAARADGPERLDGAYLVGIDAGDAISFADCVLIGADLPDANLPGADLTDADLRGADLTDADLRGADLTDANLLGADLTDTNIRSANLSGALMELAATDWECVAFNGATQFGISHEEQWRSWRAAAREYRVFQQVLREAGFPWKARPYRVKEKDARRKAARNNFELLTWVDLELQRLGAGYGESPRRVITASLGIILISGVAYPFLGGVRSTGADGGAIAFEQVLAFPGGAPEWLATLATNLYFSVVTFTTLGYGDLQPATPAAQAFAGIESLVGALMVAFLVFTLGRHATNC